jgi:2-oxoisovalerate dehydrogenase E2 component (dihydrolipoyl transacylase)
LHYGKHDIAKVGSPLVDIETEDDEVDVPNSNSSATAAAAEPMINATGSSNYQSGWETPAVRRLLSEYGLKVSDVTGSGKSGRVLKGDVLNRIKLDSLQKGKRHSQIL